VPMSIVGSFEFFQTGNWMLYPGKITVLLHDTIETAGVNREDLETLRGRVWQIVAAPVEGSMKNSDDE